MRDLAKRYGPVEAVRGVSFEVRPGEIFGLLGSNGAGKTTTLECILGLRTPDEGSITLNGVDARADPVMAKRLVGAQLQSSALQAKITPRQAIELFASFYTGADGSADLLAQFHLTEKADESFDTLSGGQKQRLFLALANINRPQLLVLDEPTAGLDPSSRREIHQIIASAKAEGRSVLLSTHYLDEAEQLCDRVAIIHDGRLIAVAAPTTLIVGSKKGSRLNFRTQRPFGAEAVRALPSVVEAQLLDGGWQVTTAAVNRTISRLVSQLEAEGNELIDLQIHRPSLEDVFVDLTGREWIAAIEEQTL